MKLLLDDKNVIIGMASIGSIEGAIDYNGLIPDGFEEQFKPNFYMLKNNLITENPNYVAPEPALISLSKQDKINAQIMLNQAKQKEDKDKFNAQILLKLAGGNK